MKLTEQETQKRFEKAQRVAERFVEIMHIHNCKNEEAFMAAHILLSVIYDTAPANAKAVLKSALLEDISHWSTTEDEPCSK